MAGSSYSAGQSKTHLYVELVMVLYLDTLERLMNILCLIKLRHIRQDVRYPSID